MKWFVPSWNGDLRLTIDPEDKEQTVLTIEKPTVRELETLHSLKGIFVKQGWVDEKQWPAKFGRWRKPSVRIAAPLSTIGPYVTATIHPGPAVLTAIILKDGEIITLHGDRDHVLDKAARKMADDVIRSKAEGMKKELREIEKKAEEQPEKEPEAVVTTKRPTPSCPQCQSGAIEPASEVLLSFLNEREHASWAKDRTLVVDGGMSGHKYLLAHRHSQTAQRVGRICYDLTDRGVVHFHDWSVPPEEEILAAMLVLKYREPWLRNEATCLNGGPFHDVFKNPFGDFQDGVMDSAITGAIGGAVLGGSLFV